MLPPPPAVRAGFWARIKANQDWLSPGAIHSTASRRALHPPSQFLRTARFHTEHLQVKFNPEGTVLSDFVQGILMQNLLVCIPGKLENA